MSLSFYEKRIRMRFLIKRHAGNPDMREKAHCDAPMTETSRKIGQQLHARRRFLQLRQRDLAELAGVTLRGLTDLENGWGNPTLNQLAKIAAVLGMEVTLTERSFHAPS
jgi:DNA-binding XRE family transcriptional regulator